MQVTVWHQVRIDVDADTRGEAIEEAYRLIEATTPGETISLGFAMVGEGGEHGEVSLPSLRLVE